jgi:hypothetical protein
MSDYQEAIQNPSRCFSDPALKAGAPALNALGLPLPVTGGFCSVYQVSSGKSRWAVRCFLHNIRDLRDRYAKISGFLRWRKLKQMVGFDYVPEGIRVRGSWHPVLKMEWVDGDTLNAWVGKHVEDAKALRRLDERWAELMEALERAQIGHCDLQHGNVLVDGSGHLRLIDYDGMYVPPLKGRGSHEKGHPAYQHPQREGKDFDERVDRFPALVVHTSLLALAEAPGLWKTYYDEDNLLFRRSDFADPDGSPLFRELSKMGGVVAERTKRLREACKRRVTETPRLRDVRGGRDGQEGAPAPRRRGFLFFPLARRTEVKPARNGAHAAPAPPVEAAAQHKVAGGGPVAAAKAAMPATQAVASAPAGGARVARTTAAPIPAPAASPRPAPAAAAKPAAKRGGFAFFGRTSKPASAPRPAPAPRPSPAAKPAAPPNAPPMLVLSPSPAPKAPAAAPPKLVVAPAPAPGAGAKPAAPPKLAPVPAPVRIGSQPSGPTGHVSGSSGWGLDWIRPGDMFEEHVWKLPIYGTREVPRQFLGLTLGTRLERFVERHDEKLEEHGVFIGGHRSAITALSFAQDGRLLASGSRDGTVRVWNVRTGLEEVAPLETRSGVVTLAMVPAQSLVAAVLEDRRLVLWDFGPQRRIVHLEGPDRAPLRALAVSADGRWVAAGGARRIIHVWQARDGAPAIDCRPTTGRVESLAFTPDASGVVCGTHKGRLELFDRDSGHLRWSIRPGFGRVTLLAAPSRWNGVLGGAPGGTIARWALADGSEQQRYRPMPDRLVSLAAAADGSLLLAGSVSGTACVHDLGKNHEVALFEGHPGPVTAAAMASTGRIAATGAGDGGVRLWSVA